MGERRERERVPVSMLELTKQWKAALKSRIDEEIGVLVQLNTRWFEENISKVKDDDQLHLQTELENVTRSLDLLRNLSSEMFSGDVAEMVILVEREPKGEQEAAAIDTAGKVRREYGEKGAATCVERPGLKKEPQVIDRGRREENFESPEIEPGTDAGRLVARDAQEPAEDIENSAASTREPAKDAGNGEEMQWETLKDVSTPRPQGGTQEASPFANAQRFTIHHATFITSETANFSTPAHGM
ncbi:hypothetical protein EST38_g3104 [Candolleomyces aberdarensis]|uniref:Uncharacterized protein n=1 Tax=Candolleomyces aberdarensis TaxID=2316362 RepID=A0A4Q2DT19_9AGAR|nr:hypothetical protein EST38_g3104 [Candolleomyces aberdarensis]